jgi:hypothetical protein
MAADGKMFSLANRTGTVNLTQVLGEMNGMSWRFEWIVDGSGNLTHQMFVVGGRITGVQVSQRQNRRRVRGLESGCHGAD